MKLSERIMWLIIWSTHWMGWHQTLQPKSARAEGYVWCVDCLMWKRNK